MKRIFKRNIFFCVFLFIFTIMLFTTKTKATNVITNTDDNGNIRITQTLKTIDENNAKLIFEFENTLPSNDLDITTQSEVVIVIDNTGSMTGNRLNRAKIPAKSLVEKVFSKFTNVKVSLVTAEGIIVNSGTSKEGIINSINSLTVSGDYFMDDILTQANNIFSSDAQNKYIILFTDGTEISSDSVVQAIKNNGVSMQTMIIDNNESEFSAGDSIYYYENDVQVNDNSIIENIYKKFVKVESNELKEIVITNSFSDDILKLFDVLNIKATSGRMKLTDDEKGYIWTIPNISATEKLVVTADLVKKEKLNFENVSENKISVLKNIDVSYKNSTNETISKKFTESNKIYTGVELTVEILDKNNRDIKINNARLEISAANEKDEIAYYSENLYTSNGVVTVNSIKEFGNILLEIEAFEMPAGYKLIDTKAIKILNSLNSISLVEDSVSDDIEVVFDETTGSIKVTLFAEKDSFDLNVTVVDENNNKRKLANTEISVMDSEGTSVKGTTDKTGIVLLKPSMPSVGTYTYKIKIEKSIIGYNSNFEQDIEVTFDEKGFITNVIPQTTDNISLEFNENSISLIIKNSRNCEFDMLDITLHETNNGGRLIQNAEYEIYITSADGFEISVRDLTDSYGKINVDFYGNENISIKIKQISSERGYKIDEEEKEIILNRNNGILEINEDLSSGDMKISVIDNDIYVKLTNDRKTENNIINIQAVLETNNEMKLQNIPFTITSTSYTFSGVTDIDGNIKISDVVSPGEGTYTYTITLGELPSILYEADSSVQQFEINVTFNEDGYITNVEKNTDSVYVNAYMDLQEDEKDIMHIANVEVSIRYSYAMEIYIVKEDESTGERIDGVLYDITIKAYDSEKDTEIVSTIEQETNSNGQVAFYLPIADRITLNIKESKTKNKYVINKENRTIILELSQDTGYYELIDGSTEGINIDLNKQEDLKIILYETAKLKVDSNLSAKLNINLDVSDKLEAKLGGLNYKISKYYGNNTTCMDSYTITTDVTGKATSEISIEKTGIYKFVIEQLNTIPGRKKAETIIAQVRYEIVDDEMKCQSFVITKGNTSIISKDTVETETEEFYKYDMNLYILNEFVSTVPGEDPDFNDKTCVINLKKVGNINSYQLENVKYNVDIIYENGTKLSKEYKTDGNGLIQIDEIYLDGVIKIELTEVETNSAYILDDTTYVINIEGDQTNGITNVTSPNITDLQYNANDSSMIFVKLVNEKKPSVPYVQDAKFFLDLNIYKTNKYNEKILLDNALFNVKVKVGEEEIVNKNLTTKDGVCGEWNIAIPENIENVEGTIEIVEVNPPENCIADTTINNIKFNIVDGELKFNIGDSDACVYNKSGKETHKVIDININNDVDKFTLAVTKVDKGDNSKVLIGSKFNISSENGYNVTQKMEKQGVFSVNPTFGVSQTVQYTITELSSPIGYAGLVKPILLEIEFDEKGNVVRAEILKQDGYDYENGIIKTKNEKYVELQVGNIEIKYNNGEETTENPDKYTIQIATKDEFEKQTFIDAGYDINLNSINGVEKNIKKSTNVESGINQISIDEYNTYEKITISFKQYMVQNGYKLDGRQKSLIINRSIENGLNYIDKNGDFEYEIDDANKIIKITNYNKRDLESLKLTIETEAKYEGLEFNVTSNANDNKNIITDFNGTANTNLNEPKIQMVEYIINSVNVPNDCGDISNVKLVVNYDSTGLIESAEITEGKEKAGIIGDCVGKRKVRVKINIDETYYDSELNIKKPIEEIPKEYIYEIKYLKEDADDYRIKLDNVEFEIDVDKESGTHKKYVVKTNDSGIAKDKYITLYGQTTYTIKELSTKEGYVLDEQPKTIVINKRENTNKAYIVSASEDLSVVISEESKEIVIKIKNNVEETEYAAITIEKTDSDDSLVRIPNVQFNILGLNTTLSIKTNEEGVGKALIPIVKEDTSCTYTITEANVPSGYITNESNIKLKVDYDANGIKSANITEGNQHATVLKTETGLIALRISNDKEEYIPSKEELKPYNVKVVKVDQNNIDITKAGAKIKVDIKNEIGTEFITKTDVTNSEGLINIESINGFGDIRVDLTELEAPENMNLETETKWISLYRNQETGNITHTASNNVFYDINNSEKTVTIYVTNKLADNLYTIVMNKIGPTDEGIEGVEFEITLPTGETIERIASVANGFVCVTDLEKPEQAGTYKYKIKETKAPEGYKLLKEDIEINVTFEVVGDEMCITKVEENSDKCALINSKYINLDNGQISKLKTENTTGNITTKNCFELDIINDELEPISIEIETVDKDNNKRKLKDACYKIEIKNDAGQIIKTIERTESTDENGKVKIEGIRGAGNLEIIIKETIYPKGYKGIDEGVNVTKKIKVSRSQTEGTMTAIEGVTQEEIDNENRIIKTIIENELKDGEITIKINKLNKEGEKLEGATFGVEVNGITQEIGTTNAEGTISTVISLPKSQYDFTYVIKETKTPKGYKKIGDKQIEIKTGIRNDGTYGVIEAKVDGMITLVINDTLEINVINEEMEPFKIEIETVNKDNTNKKLSGAKYKIIVKDIDENKVIRTIDETVASNELGKILTEEIKGVGNIEITIEEIVYPKGYKGAEEGVSVSKTIKINRDLEAGTIIGVEGIAAEEIDNENRIIKTTIENELKDSEFNINIHKTDKETTNSLANVKFKVTAQKINGEKIKIETLQTSKEYEEIITDSNGIGSLNKILVPKVEGEYIYIIEETEVPKGYKTNYEQIKLKIVTGFLEDGLYGIKSSEIIANTSEELTKPIEIVLTKNNTSYNTESFKDDLYGQLQQIGVDTSEIKIETVETNNLSSNSDDAETILNSWNQVGQTVHGTDSQIWNFEGENVICKYNTDHFTGYYYPMESAKGIVLKYDAMSTNGDNDVIGSMIRFNENEDGTVTTYVFAQASNDHPVSETWAYYYGLYKIESKSFHESNVTLLQACSEGWRRNEYSNYEIQAEGNTIKVKMNGNEIINYTDDNNPIMEGSYGFFSWSQAQARFKNINATTTNYNSMTYEDAINNYNWNENSIHCLVSINDYEEDFLEGSTEITIQKNINYIGLGTDENKQQYLSYIARNNNNGTYIDNKDYRKSIENIAQYVKRLKNETNKISYPTITTNLEEDTINLNLSNEKLEAYKLKIKATDKENESVKLCGVSYKVKVIDTANNTCIKEDTVVTDENGQIIIEEIPGVGKHRIEILRMATPLGYKDDIGKNTIEYIIRNEKNGIINVSPESSNEKIQINNEENEVEITIENELKDGEITIEIEKVNNKQEHLANATFSIETNGVTEEIGTTDAQGTTSKVMVLPKTETNFKYTIKETKTPKGYKRGTDKEITIVAGIREDKTYGVISATIDGKTVEVIKDKIKVQVINEEIEPFKIEIETVNKDNTSQKLSGAQYKIIVKDIDENKEIKTIERTEESDNLGKVLTEEIKGVGNIEITIEEIVYPKGYKGAEEGVNVGKTIKINRDLENGTITGVEGIEVEEIDNTKRVIKTTIGNELKDGEITIEIEKVNNKQEHLANATFSIETNGVTEEIGTTNAQGTTSKVMVLPKTETNFKYTIKETKTPKGYKRGTDKEIAIVAGIREDKTYGVISATIDGKTAEVIKDKIKVQVINEEIEPFKIEIETVNKDNTSQKLSGAQYKIIVKDIDENKEIKTIERTEESDNLGKILTEEIRGVGNIEITIEEVVYPKGYKGAEEGVSVSKTIKINRDLENGTITGVEGIETGEIDNTKRVIKTTIENELKDGEITIEIEEVNNKQEHLANATFSIETNGVTEEIGITDAQGTTSKVMVLPKTETNFKYTIKETKTPKGYKRGTDKEIAIVAGIREDKTYGVISATIDGKTAEVIKDKIKVQVINEEIEPFKIEIETVNKDNTSQKLSGAQYKIIVKDIDENKEIKTIERTEESNNLGKVLTEEIKGVGNIEITIEEIVYPKGYKGAEEGVSVSKTIKINRDLENGTITGVEGIEVEEIDNIQRVIKTTIGNELKDGEITIEIEKVNNKQEHLANATFSIETNGVTEEIGTTDAQGTTSKVMVLPKTETNFKYTIKETKTPKGYKRRTDKEIAIVAGIREDKTYGVISATIDGKTAEVIKDKIKVQVINEEIEPFKIEIETVNKENISQKLSGAQYKIIVKDIDENKEIKTIERTEESNNLGKVLTEEIKGVGNIEITIEEIIYPKGYKGAEEGVNVNKTIKINRDLENGTITGVEGIEAGEIDNTKRVIKAIIENETENPTIELTLHKSDAEDNTSLSNAKFKIGKQNATENEFIELEPTNTNGETQAFITLEEQEGEYIYSIIETEAPLGYVNNSEDMLLKIHVSQANNGSYLVDSVVWINESINIYEGKARIEITNKKVAPLRIELITQDEDTEEREYISDAKYNITIKNNSTNKITKLTNLNSDKVGKIITNDIYGVGEIEIIINQVDLPTSYILDTQEKIIKIQRNIQTGAITLIQINGNNIEVTEINNENDVYKKITITMTNEIMKTYLELEMAKVDLKAVSNKLKGAKFEIILPDGAATKNGENKMEVYFETGENIIEQIPLPKKSGVYEYMINEIQPPIGYKILNNSIVLKVTVAKENHVFVVKNIKASNAGSIMAYVRNNCLTIANEANEVHKYNINLKLENLPYLTSSELKLDIQAQTGEFVSKSITSKLQANISYLMGTGDIRVNIYDMKNNGEQIGSVTYYRNPQTYEISNVQVNTNSEYLIEANVVEDIDNINNVNITIRNATVEVQSVQYSVSEDEKIIYGISPNTTVADFANNISTNQSYSVVDSKGVSTPSIYQSGLRSSNSSNNLIGTGSKLKLGNTTYTLIVKGDVDGNGKVTITDITKINLHIINISPIQGIYSIAADTNFNKEITITDLVQVKLALVNLLEL